MAFRMGDGFLEFSMRDSAFQRGLSRVEKVLGRTRAKLEGVARAATIMLTAGAAAIGLVVRAALKQEEAEVGLEAALRSQGAAVDELTAKYKLAAAEIQRVTTIGDEQALALFTQAANLGVNANQLDVVTKMAIGLARVLDMDVKTSLRNVTLALQGDTMMLRRYIPELRKVTTVAEQVAIVQRKAAEGFEQVQVAARTGTGPAIQAWNSLGDALEKVGAVFLTVVGPALTKAAAWLADVQEPLQQFLETNGALILKVTAAVAAIGVMLIVLPKLIAVVGAAITVFKGLAVAMAFTAANPLVALIGGFAALTAIILGVGAATRAVRRDLRGTGQAAKAAAAARTAVKIPKIELDFPEAPTKAKKKKVAKTLDLALTEEERGIGRAKPGGLRAGAIQSSFLEAGALWQNIAKKMNAGRQVQLMEEQTKHQKSMESSLVDIAESSELTVTLLQSGVPAVAAP